MNSIRTQCFVCIAVNMARFLEGMVVSWATTVIPSLRSVNNPNSMTSSEIGWVMSIAGIGGMMGSIATWLVLDKIGRKLTIIMCVLPIIGSFVLMTLRSDYTFLLIARVLAGIGIGVAVSAIPLYIGEITDNKIRGAMGVIGVLMTSSGQLLVLIVGPYITIGWLNRMCAFFGFTILLVLFFIPESPYYYLMKDDTRRATKSLIYLRRNTDVKAEITLMKDYIGNKERHRSGVFDLFTDRGNRRAYIILQLLSIMQVFSGSVAIPIYAYEIFGDTGNDLPIYTLVILMGTASMIANFINLITVDIFGRRPVLFFGTTLMSICLIGNGVFYTLKSKNYDVTDFTFLPSVGIVGYTIGNSLGPHSLPSIVLSEYFSTNVKAKAAMYFTTLTFVASTVALKLFQSFYDYCGLGQLFFFCSCTVVVIASILYFIMPETKDCSLRKIEDIHIARSQGSHDTDIKLSTISDTMIYR